MTSGNPLNKPLVSREAHADRVNKVRKEAYDIGFDIDSALAQNASAMRGTNTDAMLDRVFPGTTQDDYDAFDSAESTLRDSYTSYYARQRSPFGNENLGYDDLSDDDKFGVNLFGPDDVAERMFDERRANDDWYQEVYEIDDEWYDDPHGNADRHEARVRRKHNDAWSRVDQVGAQSKWDTAEDTRWMNPGSPEYREIKSYRPPEKQEVITAVGNSVTHGPDRTDYSVMEMSPIFSTPGRVRDRGLPVGRNAETLDWHREHLGHDIVADDYGEYAEPRPKNKD